MFYSSQLLSRKTPLGICWLASHLESRRLKRAQVRSIASFSNRKVVKPRRMVTPDAFWSGWGVMMQSSCSFPFFVDVLVSLVLRICS